MSKIVNTYFQKTKKALNTISQGLVVNKRKRMLFISILTIAILSFVTFFMPKPAIANTIIENQLESEGAFIQNTPPKKEILHPQVKGEMSLSTIAIGVSPAIAEMSVKPAQTKVTKVYVFNNTNVPLPIKAYPDNFSVNEVIINSTKDSNTFDASNWITVDTPEFILQPNEEKEIYISVSPPLDAEPGGHYTTVYFRPLISEEYIQPDKTYLTAQIGVLFFLTVEGEIKENAAVSLLNTPRYPTATHFLPTVYIQNHGNIHLIPTGKITIENVFRKSVYEFPIKQSIILPNTEKQYTAETKASLNIGLYRTYFTGTYGSNAKPLSSDDKLMLVLPSYKSLITLIGFILILLLIRKVYKNVPLAIKTLFGKIDSK